MKILQFIVLILVANSWCFAQQEAEEKRILDSLRMQEALDIVKTYQDDDSLREALVYLKEVLEQDRVVKAVNYLKELQQLQEKEDGQFTPLDSVLECVGEDQYFEWFKELARDSIPLRLYDVLGNEKQLWINTPEAQSTRYWLYKSATDSLGFWLHSMPMNSLVLVPDFDVYQETQYKGFKSSLMLPIPIEENPEEFQLAKIKQYPRSIIPWHMGIVTNIGFSQSYFENWVKGGENNIAANSNILAFLNYKVGKTEWENYLRWKYGVIQSEKIEEFIRNEDLLELNSKLGLKASKHWFYSTQLTFKTQLFNAYSYDNGKKERVSDLLSPGYLSLALGMDYKPNSKISLLLSPVTGRLIYMDDIENLDETIYGINKDEHLWGQLGPSLKVKWAQKLLKSVAFDTSLELFSDYFNRPENIDLDWSTTFNMQINYFMSTRLSFQMIYDDDVEIPLYQKIDGKKQKIGSGQRLQFNQNLSVGLVFKI